MIPNIIFILFNVGLVCTYIDLVHRSKTSIYCVNAQWGRAGESLAVLLSLSSVCEAVSMTMTKWYYSWMELNMEEGVRARWRWGQ